MLKAPDPSSDISQLQKVSGDSRRCHTETSQAFPDLEHYPNPELLLALRLTLNWWIPQVLPQATSSIIGGLSTRPSRHVSRSPWAKEAPKLLASLHLLVVNPPLAGLTTLDEAGQGVGVGVGGTETVAQAPATPVSLKRHTSHTFAHSEQECNNFAWDRRGRENGVCGHGGNLWVLLHRKMTPALP